MGSCFFVNDLLFRRLLSAFELSSFRVVNILTSTYDFLIGMVKNQTPKKLSCFRFPCPLSEMAFDVRLDMSGQDKLIGHPCLFYPISFSGGVPTPSNYF